MDPTSGNKYLHVDLNPVTEEFLSPRMEEETVADFTNTERPFVSLQAPRTFNQLNAKHESLSNATAILNKLEVDDKKLSTWKRLEKNFNKMTQFAQDHPLLTTALCAGILLFLVGSGITIHALLGHTTLVIFHRQVGLGAGIAAMSIYYGVCLINMARRTALKDETQKKIEGHQKYQQATLQKTEHNVSALMDQLNKEIKECTQKNISSHTEVKKHYNKALQSYNEIQAARRKLETHLKESVPKEAEPYMKGTLQTANSILEGSSLFSSAMEAEYPKIPFLKLKTDIELPDGQTNEMKENSVVAEKMESNFVKFLNYIKQNPGSVLLMVGGLAICALGGYATFLWFHGASTAYFFGQLTTTTIAPLVIYGLSLAYEGYYNC